jgi:hypothetical protein
MTSAASRSAASRPAGSGQQTRFTAVCVVIVYSSNMSTEGSSEARSGGQRPGRLGTGKIQSDTGPITGPLVSPVDSLGRFAAVLKCVEEDVCHVLVGESVDRGASVAFHLHQAGCPQGA